MHSVSDILARLIREILNKQPEILSSNQAAAVAEPVYEDRASLNKIFSEVSKQLTYKGKICRDTLSDEVYTEIFSKSNLENPVLLYNILERMERNFFRVSVKQKFLCLNTNYESTGIYILPRVSSILAEKNQLEMQEKMFAHIIYIKASQLIVGGEKYTIENIYPQADTITAVQNYEKLRIVVSPLTHGDVLDVNEVCTKSGSGFEIRGLKAPQNVENRVKKIINLACERKADIVLFPEMLGTDFMGTKEFWKAISNSQTNMPMITVLPSIWHEGKNELCAFDSAGLQLFTQQKQFPYYHNKNNEEYNVPAYRSYLKEAIYDMDRKINIFHWEGIGRIVTVICRDFITPDYRDMIIKMFQRLIVK